MKKINLLFKNAVIILPLVLISSLIFISCDIDSSINNSPNAINEANIKTIDGVNGLLISMQVATADFYSGDRSRIGAMWSRQMCAPDGLGRPQPVSWNTYLFQTDGFVDDMWKLGFRGVRIANDIINNAPEVRLGEDNEKLQNTYIGMAKAYKALLLGELAAYYGSIPIVINGLESPTFASQRDAYSEVQNLLDQALTHFQNSAAVTRDLNYGGDGAKWTKAIHSLKARYYLHTMEYDKSQAQAELGMQSGDAPLLGIYNDAAGEYSPWGHWRLTEVGEPIRATNTFIRDLQAEAGDKRLAEYFTPNADGNYVGYAQFNTVTPTADEQDPTKLVSLNKYGHYADDFPLISYQENAFILAESQFRNSQAGPAAATLNSIRAEVGIGDYSGSDLLNEILHQKLLTLFLEGQSYTDMRRTQTKPEADMPMRFIYPITEKNANPNVPVDNDNLVIW
ncbi:MAG TPA: SusD/RagB family nutrient-binding outer membrane lipoprotein, partial [Candidatus Kapabacteria bacterium]|nr:SusD/RagB family nutrient-binding outer membrane lipoprotein [Candidatus Kapabacteria bacterium]